MAEEETEQRSNGGGEERGAGAGQQVERQSADVEGKRDGGQAGKGERGKRETPSAGEVVRDMGVGAFVGAVVGAAWRIVRTMQPDSAEAVKRSVTGSAREMATAAGNAVGDVLASKPVNQLLPTKIENGKRAEVMKSTLKEAVVAAGDAAKGVLESKGGGSKGSSDEDQ